MMKPELSVVVVVAVVVVVVVMVVSPVSSTDESSELPSNRTLSDDSSLFLQGEVGPIKQNAMTWCCDERSLPVQRRSVIEQVFQDVFLLGWKVGDEVPYVSCFEPGLSTGSLPVSTKFAVTGEKQIPPCVYLAFAERI